MGPQQTRERIGRLNSSMSFNKEKGFWPGHDKRLPSCSDGYGEVDRDDRAG